MATDTRGRIIRAAIEVFGVEGLSAPLSAVAGRVGLTAPAVLYYFESKDALVEAAAIEAGEAYAQSIRLEPEFAEIDPARYVAIGLTRLGRAMLSDAPAARFLARAYEQTHVTSRLVPLYTTALAGLDRAYDSLPDDHKQHGLSFRMVVGMFVMSMARAATLPHTLTNQLWGIDLDDDVDREAFLGDAVDVVLRACLSPRVPVDR